MWPTGFSKHSKCCMTAALLSKAISFRYSDVCSPCVSMFTMWNPNTAYPVLESPNQCPDLNPVEMLKHTRSQFLTFQHIRKLRHLNTNNDHADLMPFFLQSQRKCSTTYSVNTNSNNNQIYLFGRWKWWNVLLIIYDWSVIVMVL